MRLSFYRTLAAVSLAMLVATAGFSATQYSVTFSAVKSKRVTQDGVSGTLHYADTIVGSDEPAQSAALHDFSVMLTAVGPAGTCNTGKNGNFEKISPARAMVRFQIFYPAKKPPKGPFDRGYEAALLVDYTLKAQTFGEFRITKQAVVKFPAGGTVACVALP